MPRTLFVLVALLLLFPMPARAQDQPPPGRSTEHLDGIRYELLVPSAEQAKNGYSLLVLLHGNGGKAVNMVESGRPLLDLGFVTVAPKSTDIGWSQADVDVVRKIAAKVIAQFSVAPHRRHAAGFSNGGWNLVPLAFDEELRFRTATWIASGFNGGKPPRHAKKEMGCLALAGEQDPNRSYAEAIVGALEEKVKFVDYRLQPDLGHAWPRELEPYWHYVMEVMEGRFVPGDQRSYEWAKDLASARQTMADKKLGGFVYIWSKDAEKDELALTRTYQNEALFERESSYFGRQLVAVKLEKAGAAEFLAEAKVKATPAIVVLKAGGTKVAKTLTGKLTASKLARAFRAVAKNKRLPD